jgi:hypothetical protein
VGKSLTTGLHRSLCLGWLSAWAERVVAGGGEQRESRVAMMEQKRLGHQFNAWADVTGYRIWRRKMAERGLERHRSRVTRRALMLWQAECSSYTMEVLDRTAQVRGDGWPESRPRTPESSFTSGGGTMCVFLASGVVRVG